MMLLCTGDGSNLWRIANAAGCEYIEKGGNPYVAHTSGEGQQQ